jgi:hypothetical protein
MIARSNITSWLKTKPNYKKDNFTIFEVNIRFYDLKSAASFILLII